ncbi:MAG: alpha-L-arabinofuranosidase [Hyphomicrobiales bacterium]|nr:MAG: alpha-L-arabinofuranosidase [Hyphomicrobiales bacterium]
MPTIKVDPRPLHAISPRLYMQFMEPLGTTDSSVEACWDAMTDRWRPDFIDVVRDLAPSSIRWGGILTSFWKWRESVGPRASRQDMVNYLWGGWEKNVVGVDEFLAFCEAVSAEPIMAINFAADGRPEYINTVLGEHRSGDATEAADLVSYCNDPDNAERIANGRRAPWAIHTWQIGNETSYPKAGERFTSAENARHYVEFAKAMKARDPSIQLIGWGDMERDTGKWWANELVEEGGDLVDMVAIHMMHQNPGDEPTVLHGRDYRKDYGATWDALDGMYKKVEDKLLGARATLKDLGTTAKLAITEGHLSIQPHNKSEMLREWISGLYHARCMALFERHSDIIDISTLADFAGTSWTVNAVLLGSPREQPYLLPVGHIMRLFRRHSGTHGVAIASDDKAIEVSASRSGNTLYVHVVNTSLDSTAEVTLDLSGATPKAVRAHRINPELSTAIDSTALDVFAVTTTTEPAAGKLHVPKASVTAYEIEL